MLPNAPTAVFSLHELTVEPAMSPGLVTCPPDASLATVAATMGVRGIHAVVVAPGHSRTPLVITDLDLIRASVTGAQSVDDLVLEPAARVVREATLATAVAAMATQDAAHLVVVEPNGEQPAGMLSSFDVVAVVGGHDAGITRAARVLPARPMVSVRSLSEATVAQVMNPGIVACLPQAPLSKVARVMAAHRVQVVAVTGVAVRDGVGHLLWGLIDDMALVHALHRADQDADAASLAVRRPPAFDEDTPLDRVAALMGEHGARHVVAVGANGQPSGIVSTLDLARVLAAAA